MITNEVINEIRNKVNIVDIISNYVPLTKKVNVRYLQNP